MRRVSVKSVSGAVSDLTGRIPRPSVPAFVTGRRAVVAGSTLVVVAGSVVAYLNRPRSERGSSPVEAVVDGPEGYVVVIAPMFTFLAPLSLRPYFEYCAEKGEPAGYVLSRKTVDGVRVGTAA